jgi:integrase
MDLITTKSSDRRLRIRIDLSRPSTGQIVPGPAPPKKERRKLSTLDFGNIRIPYGKYKSGRVEYWMLFYGKGKNRKRESRVSFAKLKARAQQIAIDIENGTAAMSQFTEDQRAHYRLCCKLAAEAGAAPELLIREAIEARRKASMANFVRKTCPQILDELLIAKKAEAAGARWIDDLDGRLNKFIKDFPQPLADITTEEIRLWLTRLNLAKRSFNNYRTALLTFASFARVRKYVGAEWEGLAGIKPFKITKPVEEIYTPEQICSLLFTAEKYYPQHLPTLAIMAFAGCRHCELQDAGEILDWKDVHFKTAKIRIDESVAKSNTGRRWIPMQPNLVEWIEAYAKLRGPVCEVDNLTNALRRIAKRAEVPFKRNALRNSFISYRCAAIQDIPQVAIEAGNSVSEIHKSYRRELTQEEGLRWFAIMPTRAEELPLFKHAGMGE